MYCVHCGTQLEDGSKFCCKCGKPVSENLTMAAQATYYDPSAEQNLIKEFSERVKINAIFWIVIGSLQIIAGLWTYWWLLIVGAVNLISSILDFKYSTTVLNAPAGIVKKIKPLAGPIFTLIYNLIFGGVIGVAGSIYYLVAVRGFVLENEAYFLEIERRYSESGGTYE